MSEKLFLEFEDLLGREDLFRASPLTAVERGQLLDAFLGVCEWVEVYFRWRPNLRDEGDNHVMELAIAGSVSAVVTNNVADFQGADLSFPEIRVLTPQQYLKELL